MADSGGGFFDPRNGDASIVVEAVRWEPSTIEPARTNYFSVYWIQSGAGSVAVDATIHGFRGPALLFFSPYRRIRFVARQRVRGVLVHFHANFLCVETFHAQTGCSGVLFNDPFGSPVVPLDARARADVADVIRRIEREQAERGVAYAEVVTSYLKVLLVLATRIKDARAASPGSAGVDSHRHPVVERLKALVEEHYRRHHAPAEYARLLHMTPKALSRLTRAQLGKTMTELVRERLLIDAKWELLHTLKPVKEIAQSLGFDDELYFSRLFKKATGWAPTAFREFETAIRNGSNLSMSSTHPPIPVTGAHG